MSFNFEGHVQPEEAKEEKRSRKRKNFDEVCDKTKYRRVKNIVQQLDENPGVEGALLKTLKRRDSEENDVSDESKLVVLSLMKTLHLSKRKLNDLRFWIRDMIKRGMDLSRIPDYDNLRKTTITEMIPEGFKSCNTGAHIPVVSALQHTGRRFLLRPDISEKLQDGDEIVHLAKIGSDYATGHGRLHQILIHLVPIQLVPSLFIWNIWTEMKWWTRLKFPSGIFGCGENERQVPRQVPKSLMT